MKLILNIGLNVKASSQIAAHVALEIVKANGLLVHKHKVVQSDTEPTLVVEVTAGPFSTGSSGTISTIANDLQQDCIAVYRADIGKGSLVGPRAASWGKFNPEFFFLLNGKRLVPQKAAA